MAQYVDAVVCWCVLVLQEDELVPVGHECGCVVAAAVVETVLEDCVEQVFQVVL